MEIENLKTEFDITFTNNESTGQSAEEVYQEWLNIHCDFIDGKYVLKQIDNCPSPIKTNEQLTEENQFIKQQLTQIIINQL